MAVIAIPMERCISTIMVGSSPRSPEEIDSETVKIEVNLDDADGELLGYVMDKLLGAGARDVYYTPIYMKKNRPAVMLAVLCKTSQLGALSDIIFRETTTLGVRFYPVTVHRLERHFRTLTTRWGEVRVKEGLQKGRIVQQSPEYEDCRRVAETHGVPLKEIYREIWRLLEPPE